LAGPLNYNPMSYNITNPLYPRPASNTTGYITAQATTVTAGATTVTGFNVTPPSAVDLVWLDVAGDPVRAFWEGSTPSATSGHLLVAGLVYTLPVVAYNNIKLCYKTGSTASVVTASPLSAG